MSELTRDREGVRSRQLHMQDGRGGSTWRTFRVTPAKSSGAPALLPRRTGHGRHGVSSARSVEHACRNAKARKRYQQICWLAHGSCWCRPELGEPSTRGQWLQASHSSSTLIPAGCTHRAATRAGRLRAPTQPDAHRTTDKQQICCYVGERIRVWAPLHLTCAKLGKWVALRACCHVRKVRARAASALLVER